jgi:hypothetical protein
MSEEEKPGSFVSTVICKLDERTPVSRMDWAGIGAEFAIEAFRRHSDGVSEIEQLLDALNSPPTVRVLWRNTADPKTPAIATQEVKIDRESLVQALAGAAYACAGYVRELKKQIPDRRRASVFVLETLQRETVKP